MLTAASKTDWTLVLKFFAARFKNELNPQQEYGPIPAEGKQLGVVDFTKRYPDC